MQDRDRAIAWGIIFLLMGSILYFFIPKIFLIFIILGIIFYYFRKRIDLV